MSSVCRFHKVILRECLEEQNFLLLIGRGLGLDTLFMLFVKLYAASKSIILVLGCSKEDIVEYKNFIEKDGTVEKLPVEISAQNANERAKIYAEGGVIFVTSRILVLDLLRNVVPYQSVAGILVANAHNLETFSTLWFSLKLLRYHCKESMFVKAFSNRVESLQGQSKCENIMKGLHVSKLFLWPRFEVRIADELNQSQLDLVEVFAPMTKEMGDIYHALQRLIVVLVKEVHKSFPALDIPVPDVNNSLSENWYSLISGQLLGQWLSIGARSKQLISDLSSLKKMASYLMHYDCVTFNRYVETLRSEKIGEFSAWMFENDADLVFGKTRSRVFVEDIVDLTEKKMEEKLEDKKEEEDKKEKEEEERDKEKEEEKGKEKEKEKDKKVIKFVLEPCPKWKALKEVLDEIKGEGKLANEARSILLVCKDGMTSQQLAGMLLKGEREWLVEQWSTTLDKQMYPRARSEPVRSYSAKKKKNTRSASVSKGHEKSISELFPQSSSSSDAQKGAESVQKKTKKKKLNSSLSSIPSIAATNKRDLFEKSFGPLTQDVLMIHCLDSSTSHASLLQSLKPRYVVMYNTDLAFLRALECYKCTEQGQTHNVRLYLLGYEEDTTQLKDLESENLAFEKAIENKASMIIESERHQVQRLYPVAPNSSRIGGIGGELSRPYVVVDTREFNGGKIPAKLWLQGFDVVPMQLEIGDYVVSDEVVLERKTVSDLISSFTDGRLYKQCQNMQEHYSVPVLLIEFDGGPFMLQAKSEITQQVNTFSLSSKLSLLVLHFPKLRIFWSKDTAQSLAFINALRKPGILGPDIERIKKSGVLSIREEDAVIDATSQIFLSQLPGIVSGNMKAVMEKSGSLKNLVTSFDVKEYSTIMGVSNAQALGKFLKSRYKGEEDK